MEGKLPEKSERRAGEILLDEAEQAWLSLFAIPEDSQDSVWNTHAEFIRRYFRTRATPITVKVSETLAEQRRRELEYAIRENLIKPMSVPEDVSDPEPPAKVQSFLCFLLKAKDREAVTGDLAERYGKKVQQRGKLCADFWYYKQVVWSVYPFVHYALRKLRRLGAVR